ncbi:uncharacterized protein BDV14DRAFT_152700 [Aspergillus stella-maris]|uniref:uncharacterized protein n=1 Tax=Aspergillus stella-maris TaxID=1810926 RepID=UPI003CCDA3E8
MDDNRFSWTLSTPGIWERDTDEVEEFYASLAKSHEGTGRVFFAMTGFVSFSVSVEPGSSLEQTKRRAEDSLKSAWLRLRFDHPTIASKVMFDDDKGKYKKVYDTYSDKASWDKWVDETFRLVDLPEGKTGLDWCNADPPVPERPTLFLIRSPTPPKSKLEDHGLFKADLVLRAQHAIIDGMGTLQLFNNLVAHASTAYTDPEILLPSFGQEYVNLSPPLRIAANIPAALTQEQEEHMRDILAYNASLRNDIEIASPPFNRENSTPGTHKRVALTLSSDVTAKILEACRGLNLSVTHAYHASIAFAVRDLQEKKQQERKVRYINYSLINERGHCAAPYSMPAHAASVYHSVSGRCLALDLLVAGARVDDTSGPSREAKRNEFLSIVKHVREYYLDIRNNEEHIKLVPSYWAMSTAPYPGPQVPPIPPRNETPSISISSMGVLENVIAHRHGEFSLDGPWVTGEELGTGMGLFLGTWRGRVTVSAAYNDAYHGEEEVKDFLERCNGIVLDGLGLGV